MNHAYIKKKQYLCSQWYMTDTKKIIISWSHYVTQNKLCLTLNIFKIMEKTIIATNETIKKIVKSEIERLGKNADLNHIDVSQVTDMSYLFYFSSFNGDISKWDVSSVKNMHGMFYKSKFKGDISNWDVSNVTNMRGMFDDSPLKEDDNLPVWYEEEEEDDYEE